MSKDRLLRVSLAPPTRLFRFPMKMLKLLQNGAGKELPTEAEWVSAGLA